MSTKLPPQPLGVAPGSSYWNDWYEKLRTFVDQITTSVDWNIIINKPITATGYGMAVTGTGVVVQQTSPTIVAPNIGTSLSVSGNSGFSGTIVTAKLTGAGTNGSMTFLFGVLIASTPAT